MSLNFGVIAQAGLTQAQFGDLVGVTRVTVNTWVRGRFNPSGKVRARVDEVLRLLRAAVASGRLPMEPVRPGPITLSRLKRFAAGTTKG